MQTREQKYNDLAVKIISSDIIGSGCIIQPGDSEFSYVFTAKHCLNKSDKLNDEIQIFRYNETESAIKVLDVFLDPKEDIAIIKINKIAEISNTRFTAAKKDTYVHIYGYPQALHGMLEQRQILRCTVTFVRDAIFEITSTETQFTFGKSTSEVIKGFSGSGVFIEEDDNNIIFTGIFTRLKAADGAYSSFCIYNIDSFNKLLESNNQKSLNIDDISNIKSDPDLIDAVFSISYTQKFSQYYLVRKIDAIFINYLSSAKNLWISGISGVGKTLLILRNLNEQKKNFKHIDLTCTNGNIENYFEYINNELIEQCGVSSPSTNETIYEKISNNLLTINDHNEDLILFVDEVPILDKMKFEGFILGFIKISEWYANKNSKTNKIKWIVSTRIDPSIHQIDDHSAQPDKIKATKNFSFKNLPAWEQNELSQLLQLLQQSLNFSISMETELSMIIASKTLPGRLKSIIERILFEKCSTKMAIDLVNSEGV